METTSTADPTITKVHEDSRGEMYTINLPGDRELMLLFSKKGSLRGGHSHDVPESVMVLAGRMRYHKLLTGPTDSPLTGYTTLSDGDSSKNRGGEVHMGEFLEDTWLIEWKVGTTKTGWKNTNYEPWREKVRANGAG